MNKDLFYFFNNLAGKNICFDSVVVFFASYLQYWVVAGLLLFLVFGKDKKKEIKNLILVAIATFISRFVVVEAIRFFYHVSRPFVDNPVYLLTSHAATASFPSGHAAFFFALATAVYFFNKKWSTVFFASAIFMGVFRVIVGIHWPADILAGAIVGIISAWAANMIGKKCLKTKDPFKNIDFCTNK